MRLMTVIGLAVALSGCSRVDVDEELFVCNVDMDCGDGWLCDEGVCRNPHGTRKPGPMCTPACAPKGLACCGDACVDLATDAEHCGQCGKDCPSGQGCVAGECVSEVGLCGNGSDDDLDGFADCLDTDCPVGTACATGVCCGATCANESGDLCANGSDDDCDGLADCADQGCAHQSCGEGRVCFSGRCDSGCFLDGREYEAGATHPEAPCLRCDPAADPFAWTPAPRGTTAEGCQNDLLCNGRGGCQKAPGELCAGPGDCASLQCAGGRCLDM